MKKERQHSSNLLATVTRKLSKLFVRDTGDTTSQSVDVVAAPTASDDKPIVSKDEPIANEDETTVDEKKLIVSEDETIASDDKPIAETPVRKSRRRTPSQRRAARRAASQLPPLPQSFTAPQPITEVSEEEIPEALRAYVDDRLSWTKLNVVNMANDLKVSRTSLYTLVHKAHGMTPSTFINERRMQYALQLLGIGIKVCTVAQRCGFNDPKYFGKVFYKRFGVLPSCYEAPPSS